ncbi:phosphoribosylformylglycinamidine synthase subunit I [Hasllibacter halocynthiae]|uniref:Phosphoribosylformylglycinamidine synthase subunit PurQ n=1 Tax=Hasllibacter halocynthiae TaxID=595589 RepID=A0A2T0X7S9_9RHOB|nr:phosphoribosylformylglycinamidine synthase subunit PurQ [Hasllibacter halocynthiae]PRY94986.1 phosphoribosylformylglycinamidine synthase subunit I [Hasllibacter halocynthiae]
MKAAVVTFPGSNCDRDMRVAFAAAGAEVVQVWHKDDALPAGTDVVGVPGGFSYGDYLRCGAIAANAPVMGAVRAHAGRGGMVLGICNGFQVLCEAGLLPGALVRNAGIAFVCRRVALDVTGDGPFLAGYARGTRIELPVAHHDGNYVADDETLRALDGEGRVAFRYGEAVNGSLGGIAGITSANGRVLGMMPHPERAVDTVHGGAEGLPIFRAAAVALARA